MFARKRSLVLGAVILASFMLGYTRRRPPEIQYERVEVPVEVIIEREPDTVVSFVDRVRYVNIPPAQVAIAPGGAVDAVTAFCRPVTVVDTDTVYVRPTLLLRSVTVDRGWWTGKDEILLTGILSSGDLVASDYQLRGNWTARTNADSVIVRASRLGWLGGAMELAIPLFAGALVGRAF